jgi:hypothetical protein
MALANGDDGAAGEPPALRARHPTRPAARSSPALKQWRSLPSRSSERSPARECWWVLAGVHRQNVPAFRASPGAPSGPDTTPLLGLHRADTRRDTVVTVWPGSIDPTPGSLTPQHARWTPSPPGSRGRSRRAPHGLGLPECLGLSGLVVFGHGCSGVLRGCCPSTDPNARGLALDLVVDLQRAAGRRSFLARGSASITRSALGTSAERPSGALNMRRHDRFCDASWQQPHGSGAARGRATG